MQRHCLTFSPWWNFYWCAKAMGGETAGTLSRIKAVAPVCTSQVSLFLTTMHSHYKDKMPVSFNNVLDETVKIIILLNLNCWLYLILISVWWHGKNIGKALSLHINELCCVKKKHFGHRVESWSRQCLSQNTIFFLQVSLICNLMLVSNVHHSSQNTIFTWQQDWQTIIVQNWLFGRHGLQMNKKSLSLQGKQFTL